MNEETFNKLKFKILYCKFKNIQSIAAYAALGHLKTTPITLTQSKVVCFKGLILFIYQRKF